MCVCACGSSVCVRACGECVFVCAGVCVCVCVCPRSEREVQAALDQLIAGSGAARRTTLMIAHRLSTVANVDRVVVLSHGRVVEVGPPQELMARGTLSRPV